MDFETEKETLLEQAAEARRSGALAEAVKFTERALSLDPNDARLWVRLGHLQIDREQYASAIDAFERAIAESPGFAAAYSGLGQALEAVARYTEAESALITAVRLAPTSARFVLLGDIQASLLKDSAAEESFRQALAIEPDNEEAMFNLAVRLRSSGTDDSVSLLEHATRVDPLYAAAHRELGFERLKRRELARAEHQLRTALALEPDDVWTHLYLGNVFWLSGRLTEAEDQLVRATELAPFWAAPNWLVGMFYAATGQTDRADRAFRLAASVEQRDAEAAYQLARYLLDTGFIAEGKQWLTRALELDPDHRRARALSESSPGKSGEN